MSSIRTLTPAGPDRPSGGGASPAFAASRRRAAARSASPNGTQTQVTSDSAGIPASPAVTPEIRPPLPRRPVSVPSAPN